MASRMSSQASESGIIDYDALVTAYNTSLVTHLRGHTAGADFLELWVPDEDPVQGLVDLADAAMQRQVGEMRIRISADMFADEDCGRLKLAMPHGVGITFMRSDQAWLISLAGLDASRGAGIGRVTRDAGAGKEMFVSADRSRPTYDVHPLLRPGIDALISAGFQHGIPDEKAAGKRLAISDASLGSLVIIVDPKTQCVLAAGHGSASSATYGAIFEALCPRLITRPLADVAEHGIQLAIDEIRRLSRVGGRPVAGVLLPVNAGTAFVAVRSLVRRLVTEATLPELGDRPGINFFQMPPAEQWQKLDTPEKLKQVDDCVAEFLGARNRPTEQIGALRIEKDILGHEIRVIVAMADEIPAVEKGILARDLERWLKDRLEGKLQLYLEPLRDQNAIRRL